MIFRGLYRISLTVVVLLFGCYTLRAECGVADNAMEVAPSQHYGYSSWADLSAYFNLSYVRHEGGGLRSFNNTQLSRGRVPFESNLLDGREYYATIVGTNVWVRTDAFISQSTQICKINTGDRLTVLRSSFYNGGRYWCYVKVVSGSHSGTYGYVCSDYIVPEEQYDVLARYVFGRSSNLGIRNVSKELCAVADVLLRMGANNRYYDLNVTKGATRTLGGVTVVAYHIYNRSVSSNNSMLAVVRYTDSGNDYVVLGVVPGSRLSGVERNYDGSYEIYYY